MKKFATLLALSLLSSSPSFALVRELALCTTSDGQYTVSVQDNQGTGPVRISHITATVSNAQGETVASYQAELYRGMQSVSFGRPRYQDTATEGKDFALSGPSTNFHNYTLRVEQNVGHHTGFLSDDNLSCGVFGGVIVR